MTAAVRFAKARHVDPRVNLRRRDAFVSQHFLDLAQVGPALKKVRRETVPQRVRADRRRRPDAERVLFDEFPKRFPTHSASAARNKSERRFERSNLPTTATPGSTRRRFGGVERFDVCVGRERRVKIGVVVKIGRDGERLRVETELGVRFVRRRRRKMGGFFATASFAVGSTRGGEEKFRTRARRPSEESGNRAVAKRDDSLFRAFSETTASAAVEPNVVEAQVNDFRRAAAGRVTEF